MRAPSILTFRFPKNDNGSRLLVHDGSEACFIPLDYAEDTHLVAQGGEEDDELNGVFDEERFL